MVQMVRSLLVLVLSVVLLGPSALAGSEAVEPAPARPPAPAPAAPVNGTTSGDAANETDAALPVSGGAPADNATAGTSAPVQEAAPMPDAVRSYMDWADGLMAPEAGHDEEPADPPERREPTDEGSKPPAAGLARTASQTIRETTDTLRSVAPVDPLLDDIDDDLLALPQPAAEDPIATASAPAPEPAHAPTATAAQPVASDPVGPLAVAVAASVVAVAAVTWPGLQASAVRLGVWLRRLVPLALFSRLARDDILGHGTRQEILAYIQANPGACMADIRQAVDASANTVRHHLDALAAHGIVASVRTGRRRCFFPTGDGTDPSMRRVRAVLAIDSTRRVFDVVRERPGICQQDLAARLGISATSVVFHVRRLEDVGAVKRERKGRAMAYFASPL